MESNKSVQVVNRSLESSVIQIHGSESHDQGQASQSDKVVEEIRRAQKKLGEMKDPEVKIDARPPLEVTPDTQLLEVPVTPYTRGGNTVLAVKADSDFDPVQFTCARVKMQLANIVWSHSFHQNLYNRISTQDIRLFDENDLIKCLQPLLFDNTKTPGDGREKQSNHGSSAHYISEELMEMIIARIPFPSLFKARMLSRTWFAKFPFRAVKSLQPSLENEISSLSPRWTTYCPVIFVDNDILCFDRSKSRWKALLSLVDRPIDVYHRHLRDSNYDYPVRYNVPDTDYDSCTIHTAGPLVCYFHESIPYGIHRVFVNNVITKSWRQLPNPEPMGGDRSPIIRVLQVSSECYKIILVCLEHGEAFIYNSRLLAWTVTRYKSFEGDSVGNIACLHNKLYCLCIDRNRVLYCLRINNDDEKSMLTLAPNKKNAVWLRLSPRSAVSDSFYPGGSSTFAYKDKLLLVLWFSSPRDQDGLPNFYGLENRIGIFQLDPITWQLTELCRGPPRPLVEEVLLLGEYDDNQEVLGHVNSAFDGDFIYFGLTASTNRRYVDRTSNFRTETRAMEVLAYNVENQAWSSIPKPPRYYRPQDQQWVEFAFQPGSNPFASV